MKKRLGLVLIILFVILSFCFISVEAAVGNHKGSTRSNSSRTTTTTRSSSSYDKSYHSSSYNGSSSSGGSMSFGGIIFAVIIVAVAIYLKNKKININNLNANNLLEDFVSGASESNIDSQDIVRQIHEKDPNFSESKFIEWSNEVFITLQQAWTKKDWKLIRPFESESLFRQHQLQLQEYIDQNKVNIVSNICITSSSLSKFTNDGQYDYLTVKMSVNMHDYVMDENTEEVLERNPDETYYSEYELVYMRSTGVTTSTGSSNMSTTNCPNCGAPTQITSAGECEYCHSVITTGQHDWVMCQLNCNG